MGGGCEVQVFNSFSVLLTVQPWKMKSPHWLLTTDPVCAKPDSPETMPLVLSSPPSLVAPGIRLVEIKACFEYKFVNL